jgi:diguanylate cyclase (GGDEF)-like protein
VRLIRRSGKTQHARRATTSLYRSYFRTLYLSRLAWVAFWGCFVYFLVWSIPWFGIGLKASDYTPRYGITLAFAISCMFLGMISGVLKRNARRQRETLVAWSSLYDETTGTHTRSHFYDRLSLECERAERHGGAFALLLLKVKSMRDRQYGRGNSEILRNVAHHVQDLIRTTDLLALISNDEFGVLLCGVSGSTASMLAERMRDALKWSGQEDSDSESSPLDFSVDVGMASYGKDGKTPEALVESVRAAIAKKTTSPGRAVKAA